MRGYAQLLLLLAILPVCKGQRSSESSETKLTLQIQGEDLSAGIPESFTFVLLNEGSHDIYIPAPSIACESPSYEGSVRIIFSIKAYDPRVGSSGSICINDGRSHPPTIQERLKNWILLHPGKSLAVKASMKRLNYLDSIAGVYTFTAAYDPPYISENDASILRSLKIDFPRIALKSDPITFMTSRNN